MQNILSQACGILAMILTVVCYQFNDRKKILIMQIICSVLFMLNLALRNAMSGAWLNIHGIVRALVYYQRQKEGRNWASSPLWVVLFCLLAVVITAFTWQSAIDLFPMIGSLFTTLALYMTEEKKIRLFTLPSPPCWFIYHTSTGSIGGMLNEIFVFASLTVAFFRYDLPRKKKREGNN